MIQWDPKYALEIPKVDAQHMALVALINRLEGIQGQAKSSKRDLEEVLKHLVQYIQTHFADEEKILERFAYGDFDSHKKQHEKFVATVQGFQQRFQDGEDELAGPILDFLQQWLLDHIARSDRDYVDFFARSGVLEEVKQV